MMENKDEKMLKHARNKKILKIAGITVLALGVCCTVAGFINMATSIAAMEMPRLFFLLIIGLPCIGIGLMLTLTGFRKEMATYIKNESVPVFNEAGEEMKPGISAIAGAVKDVNAVRRWFLPARVAMRKFPRISHSAPSAEKNYNSYFRIIQFKAPV